MQLGAPAWPKALSRWKSDDRWRVLSSNGVGRVVMHFSDLLSSDLCQQGYSVP